MIRSHRRTFFLLQHYSTQLHPLLSFLPTQTDGTTELSSQYNTRPDGGAPSSALATTNTNTANQNPSGYKEYNAKYCLDFVRTFFNIHLDDPWFRSRLSPLQKLRRVKSERTRAQKEEASFRAEALQSLEESTSGAIIPRKDPDCPDYLGLPRCAFVGGCRLGVGTKPTTANAAATGMGITSMIGAPGMGMGMGMTTGLSSPTTPGALPSGAALLQGNAEHRRHVLQGHAKSHLHTFVRNDACVRILDVPSHVTDEQLLTGLAEHCGPSAASKDAWAKDASKDTYTASVHKPPTAVWSAAPSLPEGEVWTSLGGSSYLPYHRTAFVAFPDAASKDGMIENLFRANKLASWESWASRSGQP